MTSETTYTSWLCAQVDAENLHCVQIEEIRPTRCFFSGKPRHLANCGLYELEIRSDGRLIYRRAADEAQIALSGPNRPGGDDHVDSGYEGQGRCCCSDQGVSDIAGNTWPPHNQRTHAGSDTEREVDGGFPAHFSDRIYHLNGALP